MLEQFIDKMLDKIESYSKIALFVHHQPDFDAYASAFSIKEWIEENIPNKQVIIMIPKEVFKENEKILFNSDQVLPKAEELKNFLGIILDTPSSNRVLTQMHIYCKELIIIDHHPKLSCFTQLEFIEPTYCANAEIIAEIFFHLESTKKYKFNSSIAQYLYAGILTDTNNLMSSAVSPRIYNIVSKLVFKGINRTLIHDSIMASDINNKLFHNNVLSKCVITPNGLSFSVVTLRDIKKYKIIQNINIINNLQNILNIEIWTTLIYDLSLKKWYCSMRSKEIQINTFAQKFEGGGHKYSAATFFNKKKNFYKFIFFLDRYLKSLGLKNSSLKQKRKFSRFKLMFWWFNVLLKIKLMNDI